MEGRFATQAFWSFLKANLSDELANLRIGLYSWSDALSGTAFKDAMKSLEYIEGGKAAMFGLAARAITACAGYMAAIEGEGIYLGLWE